MKETKGWMRPHELDRRRERDELDPVVEGSRYGLARELSQAIWERVCARATDRGGRLDLEQARRRFHEIAARIAARGRRQADVGKRTRVDTEQGGAAGSGPRDELTTRAPGRRTQLAAEAHRWGAIQDVAAPANKAAIDEAIAELIDDAVDDASDKRDAPLADDRRLPIATLERMEQAFGQRFGDVEIHLDSAEMPGGIEAFTRGRHIFFGHGAFDPDSSHGEHVIAHELAHVAQQSRPMTASGAGPTRAALEAEAHEAALAALAGRAASVNLFAPSAAALGFSDGGAPPASARGSSAPSRGSPARSSSSAPSSRAPSSKVGGAAIPRASGSGGKAQPRITGTSAGAPPTSAALRRSATGDGLHIPEAPRALTPGAADRLHTVQTGNQGNAVATTTLPTGQQQTDVGRAAVEEPQAEQDARAQHGVVTEVDDRPPPSPEIEQACARIRQVIRDKRPPDEDKLVEAKPREMAQEAGNQMSAGVQERTDSVRKGYSDMEQPPPGSPSSTPVPPTLPPDRAQTQTVDAGAGAPDPLLAADVSLDADVADQKKKIEDAGMNTDPGKLVTDGPIGDARGGVDDLQNVAKTDPEKVIADQAAAIAKAKGDMRALQQAADKALADARAGAVDQMATHTTGVKGSEEQQRAQAGEKMKGIFDRTQKAVDTLLQPLSGDAVARWDAGVAQLSTEFEASLADVKRRIDERHSGFTGALTGAWDWATGLPGWVTEGYDRAEARFGDGATNLIRDISRDVNKVIEDCKQIIQQARKDIDAVVKSLPASLQTWAQGEAAKLNTQLDALDKRVDQTQKGINKDLIGRANGAVQQVREQVADLREKAKGAIAKVAAALVEFAKNPAKAIVNGLLQILGIPPASFWSMLDRLGDVVGAIAKDPVKFGKTLISGAAQGFAHFFEQFPTHLREILMSWLFGTMGSAGVPMPTDFSGPGIMATVLGIVGIDGGMVMSMLGADVSDPAEMAEVHQELHGVLSGDPKALVELLREHFDPSSLIPLIKEAAINFLMQAIITRVAVRIAAMLVPGGAILQAVEAIFRVLVWVVTNAARIFTLIESLVATAGQAVAGNVAGVAAGVEGALVQIIVLVIDFLAGYVGAGGLPGKLKGVIMKLSGKLKGALKKVLDAIKKRAKARARTKHPNANAPGQAPQHGDGHDPGKPRSHDDDDPKKRTDHDDDPDPRKRKDHDDPDPRKRKDHDDPDPRKRTDHDPKKRKNDDDDSDEKSRRRAELEKRLKLANQEIHQRFRGHKYPEKEGRRIVAQIAGKHRVQHHLRFEGHRWQLTLRVNPELSSYVEGEDYEKLRRELDAADVHAHSARAMANREYKKALDDKKDTAEAKRIAVEKLRRAIANDAAIEADPDLRKREQPHAAGDDFERVARAHVQAEATAAGRIYLPGPRAQANPRAGFDCVEIDLENGRVIVHEIKRGDLRPVNQQSSSTGTRKDTIPLDAGDRTGGSEGVRHVLRHPEDADALAADRVLSKVRQDAGKTEGEIKEVEVHFASELSASVNNLEANLDKLIAQLQELVPKAPPELARRYQDAVDLVTSIRNKEGGELHRIISVGGAIREPEKEAAMRLLEASRKRLERADGVVIKDLIRQLDEHGKEIGG